MSFLLREALLGSLGIESDLTWGTSKEELSAIDLELIPPSAGALIAKITDLGNIYRALEESTETQQGNPFCQALYDSIENYLDQYRSTVLKADNEITSGLLTTLTGLVAYLEPFQHELQFVGRIVPPLISATPLEMLNKMHEYVVISPPSIAAKLSAFESAIHQVAINQLIGFLFYHQQLPDIFERPIAGKQIIYSKGLTVTFIPAQLSELLLLIVNVSDHCVNLFKDMEPPDFDQLIPWIAFMAKTSSNLLAARLSELWPKFFYGLKSIWLLCRFDHVRALSHKMLQPFVSSYDLNFLLSKLSPESNLVLELVPSGLQIHSKLEPPLDLVVTADHQTVMGEMFKIFMKIAVAEQALAELWQAAKRKPRLIRFIGFVVQVICLVKEYIVLVVITPAVTRIEKAWLGITDFLKFQAEFASFVLQLSATFPAANPEFQNAIHLIADKVAEMRELLIGKDLLSKMTFDQVMEVVADVGKPVVVGAAQLGAFLNAGEESGINFQLRMSKLVQCIENAMRHH
jgi:hypothetical protein